MHFASSFQVDLLQSSEKETGKMHLCEYDISMAELHNKLFYSSSTLISLINVEFGINVEGVQKLPNH